MHEIRPLLLSSYLVKTSADGVGVAVALEVSVVLGVGAAISMEVQSVNTVSMASALAEWMVRTYLGRIWAIRSACRRWFVCGSCSAASLADSGGG